jgi:hypothetical protein
MLASAEEQRTIELISYGFIVYMGAACVHLLMGNVAPYGRYAVGASA